MLYHIHDIYYIKNVALIFFLTIKFEHSIPFFSKNYTFSEFARIISKYIFVLFQWLARRRENEKIKAKVKKRRKIEGEEVGMDDISRAWTKNFLVNFFSFFTVRDTNINLLASWRGGEEEGGGQRWNKKRANKESWEGRYRQILREELENNSWTGLWRAEKTWLIFPGPEINFDRGLYIYLWD